MPMRMTLVFISVVKSAVWKMLPWLASALRGVREIRMPKQPTSTVVIISTGRFRDW
jgi:hypothetical protein